MGGFYSMFDGKEDCFLQAYDRILAIGRERLVAASEEHASWPERACSMLQALLELVAAEPTRARIVLVEAQTAGEAALARYEKTIDEMVPLLRRGREYSPVAADLPQTLEVASIGGLLWYLQQRVVSGDLEDLGQYLPEMAEIVLEPYLGPEETERLVQSTGGSVPTTA